MAFRDLRDTMEHLARTEQLLEVHEPVSAEYELAATLALAGREHRCAVVFRNVVGFEAPVVGNLACSREVVATGMEVDPGELPERIAERLAAPITPRSTPDAPVLERKGEDLRDLPVLTHFEGDSGAYLTSALFSLRDPDTGEIMRAICRMEVRGPDRLGIALVTPPLGNRMARYRELGARIPAAVTVGHEPVTFLGCALGGAYGADRLAAAGGLRQAAVDVAEGPETGIAVPARAEYLLEGELDPNDCRDDGPFGEISGYGLVFSQTPTLRVRSVRYRDAPLYHALVPVGHEAQLILGLAAEASLGPTLCKTYPDVVDVAAVPGSFGSSVVVRVRPTDRPRVRAILHHVLSLDRVKKAVAVAADVQPRDRAEVEWSIATRCQPNQDVFVLDELRGHPIDPSCPAPAPCSKLGVDATGFERVAGISRATFSPEAADKARSLLRERRGHV